MNGVNCIEIQKRSAGRRARPASGVRSPSGLHTLFPLRSA